MNETCKVKEKLEQVMQQETNKKALANKIALLYKNCCVSCVHKRDCS